jgi:hypothetical protein
VIDDRPISLRFTSTLVLSIVCLAAPAWADFNAAVDAVRKPNELEMDRTEKAGGEGYPAPIGFAGCTLQTQYLRPV